MRILVTGAKGFIGSHLGNRFVDLGHTVLGVDNLSNPSDNATKFPVVVSDYQDYNGLNVDAIFHLAASINVDESIKNPSLYMQNNAVGTQELLEKLRQREYKGKFVYASSAEVYGSAQASKMSEDHLTDPLSPYAVSKLSAEQMCKNYAQLYGMDITVIRNFNTFGEYQRDGLYGGVIAKFTGLAKQGKDLPVYGSGEQMRDYMHISQAVNGYVLALEKDLPTIVNFGSGVPIKIIDIANFIAEKFGVKVIHEKSRPNEIMRLEADVSRAVKYGYKVETDFWTNLENYLNDNK
jgi:nucleoside-diphosphate-sugar epimerase